MNRRAQYGWMGMGALVCLFGIVLACKLRDGNRATAQTSDTPPPPPGMTAVKDESPAPQPPRTRFTAPEPGKPAACPPGPPMKEVPTEVCPEDLLPASGPPVPGSGLPNRPTERQPILIPAGGVLPTLSPPAPAREEKVLPPTTAPSPKGTVPPPSPGPVGPSQESGPPAPKAPDNPPPVRVVLPPAAGEPPLAPPPGPVQTYRVRTVGETLRNLARKTLGSAERWTCLHKLNPSFGPDAPLAVGTSVRLPADACLAEEQEPIKPLPALRSRPAPTRPKALLPLTGTFQLALDDKGMLTLPRAIREQLGNCDKVLVSPGHDKCLWLTNQAHLNRLSVRLEMSPAREADVRSFRRLYFAQTVRTPVATDGRIAVPARLAQFAELHQEVVLVGIDDHFEIWDAARWRRYTVTRGTRPPMVRGE